MITRHFCFVAILFTTLFLLAASCTRIGATIGTVSSNINPDLEYEVIDGRSIAITRYTGSDTNLSIPASIKGRPVTVIGDDAFHGCRSLTSISIPSSITTIGERAFYHCDSLTNINVDTGNSAYSSIDGVMFDKSGQTLVCFPAGKSGTYAIPSSVATIKHSAFWNCRNLIGITVPSSVFIMGDYAFFDCCSLINISISSSFTLEDSVFQGCSSLMYINVDPENSTYTSVDGVLFSKNGQTLIFYPAGRDGTYTIPSSVITIENLAFSECNNLTSVIIPPSVFIIKDRAFFDCINLTDVSLSRSTKRTNGAFNEKVQIQYRD